MDISSLLVEIERLGESGEVQNAMAKTAEVDKLKEERERIRQGRGWNLENNVKFSWNKKTYLFGLTIR